MNFFRMNSIYKQARTKGQGYLRPAIHTCVRTFPNPLSLLPLFQNSIKYITNKSEKIIFVATKPLRILFNSLKLCRISIERL